MGCGDGLGLSYERPYPPDVRAGVRICTNLVGRETPISTQILKLQEEVGEVASAWLGHTTAGLRPEKVCSKDDVIREVCDVALAALVTLELLGENSALALTGRIDEVVRRFLGNRAGSDPTEENGNQGGPHGLCS